MRAVTAGRRPETQPNWLLAARTHAIMHRSIPVVKRKSYSEVKETDDGGRMPVPSPVLRLPSP